MRLLFVLLLCTPAFGGAQIADIEYLDNDKMRVGTIVVGEEATTVCYETEISFGSGGDLKIEGPTKCAGLDVPMSTIDRAIHDSFGLDY